MKLRRAVLVALTLSIAVAPLTAASTPSIAGGIFGIELCPQSICHQAIFVGNFAGAINNRPTDGVFFAGITHEALPTTVGATVAITGGTWLIRTRTRLIAGTIEDGGTLTLNPGGTTYTAVITMDVLIGGSGTLTFTGLLDHGQFPPTIGGTIF